MQYFKMYEDFSSQSSIVEIVVELFRSRDLAHQSHLATSSFAQHKALQEYYEGIVELLDDLVETWQGTVGEKLIYDLNFTNNGIVSESDLDRFTKLAQKIVVFSESLSANFSHIKNILDEINALIHKTIYKLKFLN